MHRCLSGVYNPCQMETFSALMAFCAGNSLVTGELPAQRPVTQSFDVFFDLRLNKRLSKQSWSWWLETPSRSLWRHCSGPIVLKVCAHHGSHTVVSKCWPFCPGLIGLKYCYIHLGQIHNSYVLTHWGRDKMDAISQTTFSSAFCWTKMFEFRIKFHWSLFLRVQLTIFQHWFRWWLGADQATSHYLNQWWLDYWHIYASLGLNELTLNMLNCFNNYKRRIHILNRILDLAWPKLMKLALKQKYKSSVLQNQYHTCWCSDEFRSQSINRHGIDN